MRSDAAADRCYGVTRCRVARTVGCNAGVIADCPPGYRRRDRGRRRLRAVGMLENDDALADDNDYAGPLLCYELLRACSNLRA